MKKYLYITALILTSLVSFSQTFEKDMAIVYKNFVNANKIAYNIKYVLKQSHDINSGIISQNTGYYAKLNDTYISRYASKYTIVCPKEVIMVDEEEKYMRVKKQGKQTNEPDFLGQLKEYKNGIEKVTRLTTNKKDVITYNVELKNIALYSLSRYEISINTKTFYMEQITLFYKQPLQKDDENKIKGNEVPRLEIIFYDFNNAKIVSPNELEPVYYYTRSNKKISPSSNFKNYDVKEIL